MKYGLPLLAILFLSSLLATVYAAATVDVKSNSTVNSTSTNTGKSETHIRVNVNGEEKVVDSVKEGSNINSTVRVQAKSENGKTTFEVSGNPDTVKDGKSVQGASVSATPTPSKQSAGNPEKATFFGSIFAFFSGIIKFFKIF